jgi:anti-sigma B factor antagonist
MEKKKMIQEVVITPGQLQVALSGNIFAQEAKGFQASLTGYINKGHASISLDLSGVDYFDGAGLGALVAIHEQLLKKGGRLEIKGLQGEVKELFVLTGLNKIFEVG